MLTEYVAVDLEMTGLRLARDKILEIGAVHMRDHREEGRYHVMVNPQIDIPKKIQELTGITQEMAEQGKEPAQAVAEFLEFYQGCPLVGHNIAFDYGFLKQGAVNAGLDLETSVADTLKIARKLLPKEQKKTLEALCESYGIPLKEHHRALEDAVATARLFEILKEQYGERYPELFVPAPMQIKVKKQGPITPRQKKYLKELADYHKIELPLVDGYTKSQASRLTDQLIAQYGRMPGRR